MITPEQADTVRTLLAEGLPVREVARRTNVAYSTVRNIAVRMGRQMTRSHPNPPDHVWRTTSIGWTKTKKDAAQEEKEA